MIELIITSACVTFFLRSIPFVLFARKAHVPKWLERINELLPPALITILVVYCLKDISIVQWPYGLVEGIAILLVVGVYHFTNNTLLSIFIPTIVYMILV